MSAKDLQRMQDEQRAILLHANTEYPADDLGRMGRYALGRCGISISASGSVKGINVHELDKKFEALNPPMSTQEQMAAKFDLAKSRILFTPSNYRGL